MKLWLSKNSEVPISEQLATQIIIGIVSGDLVTGNKLPSTREIARRFGIHANTVGSVYKQLAKDGYLEFKKGSGFYIRELDEKHLPAEIRLEKLAQDFLLKTVELGFSAEDVRAAIHRQLSARKPKTIALIEQDENLREILLEEISSAVTAEVRSFSLDEIQAITDSDMIFTALTDEKPRIEPILQAGTPCVFLQARSVSDALTGQARPSKSDIVAVASGWGGFLLMARTLLLAAGLDPESILVRSTANNHWQKGLASASIVICDSLTAKHLSQNRRVRVFKLISDNSINELRNKLG